MLTMAQSEHHVHPVVLVTVDTPTSLHVHMHLLHQGN